MEYQTFIDHLDRYGSDLDQWPAALRAPAAALVASSPPASAALSRARRVDTLLGQLPDRSAPPQLADRISAAAATSADRWQRLADWLVGAFWRPVLAASLPLALGFALGLTLQAPANPDDVYLLEAVGLLPFSSSFEELPYEE